MLVLTRMIGEVIEIGEDVKVEVVDVRGSKVRLGVEAPREVVVDRKEIAEQKRAERDAYAAYEGKEVSDDGVDD